MICIYFAFLARFSKLFCSEKRQKISKKTSWQALDSAKIGNDATVLSLSLCRFFSSWVKCFEIVPQMSVEQENLDLKLFNEIILGISMISKYRLNSNFLTTDHYL